MHSKNENSPQTDNSSERLKKENGSASSQCLASDNNNDPNEKINKEIITNNDEFGDDFSPQNDNVHEPTANNSSNTDTEEPENVEVEEKRANEKDQLDGDELII